MPPTFQEPTNSLFVGGGEEKKKQKYVVSGLTVFRRVKNHLKGFCRSIEKKVRNNGYSCYVLENIEIHIQEIDIT